MPYTMTADENGKITAIRTALTNAKALLQDAEAQMSAAMSNADALMAIQKAAGRAETYTLAYDCKGGCIEMGNSIGARRGALIRFHAEVSMMLQKNFTDGPSFVLAGPVR